VSDLADAAAALVRQLAPAHVAGLVLAYRELPAHSATAVNKAEHPLPSNHRHRLGGLHAAWASSPETPGLAIAVALESALAMSTSAEGTSVEVVVTGPTSPNAPTRLTSQVVQRLIDDATARVLLVSYAAYSLPAVIAALDRAVNRGVRVQLILESAANLKGGGGAHAYSKYQVYEWPIDERQPPDAKLHAKAVIVDGTQALLTSANMTAAAFDKNIELGLRCRGGDVAYRVLHHFDGLIATGVLRRVT
jgi:cardiolipin synthase